MTHIATSLASGKIVYEVYKIIEKFYLKKYLTSMAGKSTWVFLSLRNDSSRWREKINKNYNWSLIDILIRYTRVFFSLFGNTGSVFFHLINSRLEHAT